MSASNKTRVTFANRFEQDGTLYEQGKTYDLPKPLARHLLRVGKVRIAEDSPKANRPKTTPEAASGTDK